MADKRKRIDQLNASPSFAMTDLIEKERDPSGLKAHEKATMQELAAWLLGQLNYNVFPNLASLKANTIHVDTKVYCILGRLAKGDGQAKIYYYDDASMLTPDDAAVVLPDDVLVVNPGRYLQFAV